MSTYVAATSIIGPGTALSLGADLDLLLLQGVTLASTGGVAVSGSGSFHQVTIAGAVAGDQWGLFLGGVPGSDVGNNVTVTPTGLVSGGHTALGLSSRGGEVLNQGTIRGNIHGVSVNATFGFGVRTLIVNEGTISADNAITTYATSNEGIVLHNYGLVSGSSYALLSQSSSGVIEILNHGRIAGAVLTGGDHDLIRNHGSIEGFVSTGSGYDQVVNRGLVAGSLSLGDGGDRLDDRGGRIDGNVSMGDGDDTVLPGLEDEVIDGGAGLDTLDFRGSGGLRVSLGDHSGTGRAESDFYTGFERVLGSRGGADTLIGDGLANTLEGFGGADRLLGGAGADRLIGGAGKDRLTGGAGNDAFLFQAPADGGDLVADFRSNDRVEIGAGGFGGGLAAGPLAAGRFRARADNQAQDGNDRFVFRTTDATLWFDDDGNGAHAPVLIADLQPGATLTSADILIV